MNRPAGVPITSTSEKKPTWGGCLVPLVSALAILGAAGYGLWTLRARSLEGETRIADEWVTPWSEAAANGRLADVWERLTTEHYRQSRTLEATQQTYQTAVAQWGRPQQVTIESVNGTHDALSGRSFQRTVVWWAWERGEPLAITYELVETEDGYRVDDARPGGSQGRFALPANLPSGPW